MCWRALSPAINLRLSVPRWSGPRRQAVPTRSANSVPIPTGRHGLAVDGKLRRCDLVGLGVRDLPAAGRVKERTSTIRNKTAKPVRFEITETTSVAQPDPRQPASVHATIARIVRGRETSPGPEPSAQGTHSMPRTKVAPIYEKAGNLRAVQSLPGHTKMDSTVRHSVPTSGTPCSRRRGSGCKHPTDRHTMHPSTRKCQVCRRVR